MPSVFAIIRDHAGEAPVPIEEIIEECGISYRERPLDEDVSGSLRRLPSGRYRIEVNADHALVRRRFTAAHELGHYVYHRDLIGDGIDDDRLYRAVGRRFRNSNIRPYHETEANNFAATVLMPTPLIAALNKEGLRPWRNHIPEIAERLLVSQQALRIRLGLEG